MIKKTIKKTLLTCFILLFSKNIFALDIVITGGSANARPISIIPFLDETTNTLDSQITKVIEEDLTRSGLFKPITVSQADSTNSLTKTDYDIYLQKNVEIVLEGSIKLIGQDQYQVSYQLIDTLLASKQQENSNSHILLSINKKITSSRKRVISHIISNDVYEALTGDKGAFLTKIAYVVVDNQSSRPYKLIVSDYDNYNKKALLQSKEPIMSPNWSPNGQNLVYVSFETGKPAIFEQNIFSAKRNKLTDFAGINSAPKYSPNGKQMAMVLSKDGSPDLYVMDIATKNLSRLTNHNRIDTEPSWMPNGKEIIFSSERGGSAQIYKVNTQNKAIKRLTFQGDMNLGASITPSGNTMVMVNRTRGQYRIATQNIKTGNMKIITKTKLDESPSIAPNGSMIIYSTLHKGKKSLALVSTDGTFKARLPSVRGEVKSPAWSPFLYY